MNAPRGRNRSAYRAFTERLLNLALLNGLVARLSYHCGLHGRLGVTRYALALPAERRLARPLRLAFASDFHAGPPTHHGMFDDLFRQIDIERPDILALGGDFVSGPAEYASVLLAGLAACHAPLGKFAVFGNHDLSTDDVALGRMLAGAGVQMLVNRNVDLPAPFDKVSLCGLDDPWSGTPDGHATFTDAQATRILLMHAPDGLLLLDGHRFDAAFAGHTHGGQIAMADGTPIIMPKGPLSRPFHYGRFEVEGNGSLMVSRGVGCSGIPVRVNAAPELVICTIQ